MSTPLNIGILVYPADMKKMPKPGRKKSIQALHEAIKQLGHTPKVIYASQCQLFMDNGQMSVLHPNYKMDKLDIVIPRLAVYKNLYQELLLLDVLEKKGVIVFNKSLPIINTKNKITSLSILANANIPIPRTKMLRNIAVTPKIIKDIGGLPLVLKSVTGAKGQGVSVVESLRSLKSVLDMLWESIEEGMIMAQEYIKFGDNYEDFRLFVVGDKVVAAMKRSSVSEDFRTNLAKGAVGVEYIPTEEEKKMAVEATKALGLDYSGVDIIHSDRGPLILEVNSNPGVEGITAATGVDVPKLIVEYGIKLMNDSVEKMKN